MSVPNVSSASLVHERPSRAPFRHGAQCRWDGIGGRTGVSGDASVASVDRDRAKRAMIGSGAAGQRTRKEALPGGTERMLANLRGPAG
jgi:hypothetical protein